LDREEKIDTYKESRNWLSIKEAVLEYIENRKRKRVF